MINETIAYLESARASLEDPEVPFGFMSWRTCTAGHIFQATNGDPVDELFHEWEFARVEPYRTVIQETAHALGWDETIPSGSNIPEDVLPVDYVSVMTATAALRVERSGISRKAAISVVDEALKVLREQEPVHA